MHNEELHDLNSSPKTIRVSKSRRMRLTGYVALWGTGEVHTGFCWGNLRERERERERPLGRPKRRWQNNIEMNI